MTPFQQKFPSGRTVKVSAPLPVPSDERLSVVLIGSKPGFLSRVLRSGILKPVHSKTVLAPRIASIPGRSIKMPSFGSAEAMEARKNGLVQAVRPDLKQAADNGEIVDVTPQAMLARQSLWQIPADPRHDLIRAALSAWIPEPPDGGMQVTIVEVPDSDTPLKTRLASLQKLESPFDHLLYDLLDGSVAGVLKHNPENLFLVSSDCKLVCRIDSSDKLTDTRQKILAALVNANRAVAGLGEVDTADGAAADVFDVDALAAATGAGDKVAPAPSPVQAAADRKRAERIEQFAKEQTAVQFRTRQGTAVPLGEMLAPVKAAPVTPRKANGAFSDPRVAEPKFDAISLSYLNSGTFDRDTAAVVASLANDPLVPHFVQKIERTDSSDSMNLKETLSVQYRDPSGRSTTVHVDVPILTRDGYMVLNGNKYNVTKQIMAMPIIKVRPSEVLITTAYNKATIERFGQNATAMSSYIRLLAGRIDKESPKGVKVELASATAANAKYRSTIEYDDVARTVRSIRTANAAFIFSRPALDAELEKVLSPKLKVKMGDALKAYQGSHPVGFRLGDTPGVIVLKADGSPIIVTETTEQSFGDADLGTMVHAAVRATAPDAELPEPSVPQRKYAYSRVKMLSQYLPTAVIVGYNLGLVPMLRRAEIDFQIVDAAAFRRSKYAGQDAIRFADGVVVFNPKRVRDSLLVNGLKELDTEETPMAEFAPGGMGWVDHIADRLGGPGHAKALVNYQTSFIDPMTRDLLAEEGLPTDMAGVLLYASAMLENNEHSEPNDMKSYRLRGPELVNTILYKVLHREMERVRATRESASPQKLMVNQSDVIRLVQNASNVEEVSELNPLLEAELRGKATWTGAAGGLGDGRTVNRAMRAYHKSMHGIFGYYSPDSAEIGVKRTLAYGAAVKDVRGRFDHDLAKSHAAQVLALGELITPFVAQHSDPPKYWASCR